VDIVILGQAVPEAPVADAKFPNPAASFPEPKPSKLPPPATLKPAAISSAGSLQQ
jgi:hypothetical protein